MFKFKVTKSHDVTDEEFMSAISCAKTSIESVLSETTATVDSRENVISIAATDLDLQQCKTLLAGCFCDGSGMIYPEFRRVEAVEG